MTVSYCSRSDLVFHKPDIGQYDRKAVVQNWVTDSGTLRKSADVGQAVSMVYRDGLELGDAQANSGAVTSDGYWFYDSSLDILWLNSTVSPAVAHVIEVGIDVATGQNSAIAKSSDFIRAYCNKTIMPRKGTYQADASGSTYEEIVVRATALLAISYLLRGIDDEKADYYEEKVYNTETDEGIADRIRKGSIKLWNEATERKGDGVVSTIVADSSSTGTIVDTMGQCNVPFDLIKVYVNTGGTFQVGVASPVKVDSYISDDTGLQMQKFANDVTVDGGYIPIGRGISARMSEGVYTTGDTFFVECNGQFVESGEVKSAQAIRGW